MIIGVFFAAIYTLKMLIDICVFIMRLGIASQVLVVPHTPKPKLKKKQKQITKKKTTKNNAYFSLKVLVKIECDLHNDNWIVKTNV